MSLGGAAMRASSPVSGRRSLSRIAGRHVTRGPNAIARTKHAWLVEAGYTLVRAGSGRLKPAGSRWDTDLGNKSRQTVEASISSRSWDPGVWLQALFICSKGQS